MAPDENKPDSGKPSSEGGGAGGESKPRTPPSTPPVVKPPAPEFDTGGISLRYGIPNILKRRK